METMKITIPESIVLKPIITVFGVGGAGGNAVNNMIDADLKGANFVVANTDAQALEYSKADYKIQLGTAKTRGLGAGAMPEVGMEAAEESEEDIIRFLENSNMVFITAGMGGGTGTGAAPVVAKLAKQRGILTVGVVTKPFHFEGAHRMRTAERGVLELQKYVDTLIVIPNQNLFRIANERTTFADAFKMADEVLHAGVRGVTDLMIMPGLINLDFADIKAVMSEMGKAMMGTGEASGENRAIEAAERAIANPLLEHHSMRGAKGVLINITGGQDMTLFEVDAAANRIREEVGDGAANIIFGSTFNPDLDGILRVSVVATGIDAEAIAAMRNKELEEVAANAAAEELLRQQQEKQAAIAPIIQEEELVEVEEKVFAQHVALEQPRVMAQPTFVETAPPHYAEYNMPQATMAAPIQTAPIVRAPAPTESRPLSLLKKMWGLTKASPTAQEPQPSEAYRQHNAQPKIDAEGNEVYDIPAFLRRRK